MSIFLATSAPLTLNGNVPGSAINRIVGSSAALWPDQSDYERDRHVEQRQESAPMGDPQSSHPRDIEPTSSDVRGRQPHDADDDGACGTAGGEHVLYQTARSLFARYRHRKMIVREETTRSAPSAKRPTICSPRRRPAKCRTTAPGVASANSTSINAKTKPTASRLSNLRPYDGKPRAPLSAWPASDLPSADSRQPETGGAVLLAVPMRLFTTTSIVSRSSAWARRLARKTFPMASAPASSTTRWKSTASSTSRRRAAISTSI